MLARSTEPDEAAAGTKTSAQPTAAIPTLRAPRVIELTIEASIESNKNVPLLYSAALEMVPTS